MHKYFIAATVAIAVVALLSVWILYGRKKEGFESKKAVDGSLVWYKADWCGHCKAMESEWEKVVTAGIPNRVVVDTDPEMKSVDIKGFPTIRWVRENGSFVEFNKSRVASEMIPFAEEQMNA